MFIDASALTALLTDESDARELLVRIERVEKRMTSPLAVWETCIAVSRKLGLPLNEAAAAIDEYLLLMNIQLVEVPPETTRLAIDAFARYGKGNHPARLNFGDYFAYACARHFAQPLLFKGADFPLTDIEAA